MKHKPTKEEEREVSKNFADRLRVMRERQGLTLTELAARSGLTPAAISQLERAEREPSFSSIYRLSRALGTTPNDLMGIGDESALDPSLRGLFRDVKQFDKQDLETVQAFVQFLASKKEKGDN